MNPPVEVKRQGDMLHAVVPFEGIRAADALRAWLEPELVLRWWGAGQLYIDPRPGGEYRVYFATGDQSLIGKIRHIDPAGSFAFDWRWEHLPEDPTRVVTVDFTDTDFGCELVFTHGPYGDGEEEDETCVEHQEGWAFFLGRMREVLAER